MPEMKKRKIEFYWLSTEFNRMSDICSNIGRLSYVTDVDNSAYIRLAAEDRLLSIRFDSIEHEHIDGAICNTRTGNFPYVDMRTEVVPLELDENAQGLIEKTHFIMVPFVSNNEAGSLLLLERNHHAGGIQAFVKYMRAKGDIEQERIQVSRLSKDDIFLEADGANRCTVIDFEARAMSEDFVKRIPHNGLRSVLGSCCLPNIERHRVVLSMGRSRKSMDMDLFHGFVDFFRNYREYFINATAKVATAGVPSAKLIDFVSEEYIREINVPTVEGNSKYLDSNVMYQRLLSLYEDERQMLRQLHAVLLQIGEQYD